MAVPTPTTRVDPSTLGIMLTEGYQSLVTFAANPSVLLWEISITPSGRDGGELIDCTTQFAQRTLVKRPQKLYEVTDMTFTCGYDPAAIAQVENLVNKETTITVTLPDGSNEAYFGCMTKFERGAHEHGTLATGTVTIGFTNWDVATHTQQQPQYVNVPGT